MSEQSEQFVRLENGTNISIDSAQNEEGFTVNCGGQPVTIAKYFGPLSAPDVRIRLGSGDGGMDH